MALGCLQQIRETTKHMRANSFALIGAHHGGVFSGRNAEVVGPEPHQPLDQADLGARSGVKTRFGLAQNDLLRQRRFLHRHIGAGQLGHLRSGLVFATRGRLLLLTRR